MIPSHLENRGSLAAYDVACPGRSPILGRLGNFWAPHGFIFDGIELRVFVPFCSNSI